MMLGEKCVWSTFWRERKYNVAREIKAFLRVDHGGDPYNTLSRCTQYSDF